MADVRLRSVTINLTCGQPELRLFNVQWPVGGRAVTENDIRGLMNEGRCRAEVDGREPIHVLPSNFAVLMPPTTWPIRAVCSARR